MRIAEAARRATPNASDERDCERGRPGVPVRASNPWPLHVRVRITRHAAGIRSVSVGSEIQYVPASGVTTVVFHPYWGR